MRIVRGRPFHFLSDSPETTRSIGRALGVLLKRGDTVFIYGGIGAGKTVFVSGVASALNICEGRVTSPTFIFVNVYEGDIPLYHFDAYRIKSPDELYETGFFEYSGGNCVVVVEWAENIKGCMPEKCVEVRIEPVGASEADRMIHIEFNRE